MSTPRSVDDDRPSALSYLYMLERRAYAYSRRLLGDRRKLPNASKSDDPIGALATYTATAAARLPRDASHLILRGVQMLPILDHGLSALLRDLEERGMLDDVTIVAWGEFGRSPKINKNGGRDHWPKVGMAMLAGGGMRCGQVIGATDRQAGEATSRPVSYQDVLATVYRNLGIDALRTTIDDPRGRPRYLLEEGQLISEAV